MTGLVLKTEGGKFASCYFRPTEMKNVPMLVGSVSTCYRWDDRTRCELEKPHFEEALGVPLEIVEVEL